ncbi:MAG: hypothetical protein A3J38_01335, partial [Gammaproteobacteria bacterium RIFCSPHIGHO2_12_FULL_45_9]
MGGKLIPEQYIKALPESLINQIAAGEVVGRPASVVKELVENSIDAGASWIKILIREGGHRQIKVSDNGQGIATVDLPLALSRHATSKLATLEDFDQLLTLGFRGEALASIAAVSRMTVTTRMAHVDQGASLSTEGGSEASVLPASHPVGTTVDVRDLFFNTPVRRRFLRSPETEWRHIETVMQQMMLSRFDTGFTVSHQGKVIWEVAPCETIEAKEARIAKMLGEALMQEAIRLDFRALGLQVSGWIADPAYTRTQGDTQFWFLNGRWIRDKMLLQAVREAYADVLFHGRHPAYILYLEMSPTDVDVNVHPAKHDVRFRDPNLVRTTVKRSIEDTLAALRTEKLPLSRTTLPGMVPYTPPPVPAFTPEKVMAVLPEVPIVNAVQKTLDLPARSTTAVPEVRQDLCETLVATPCQHPAQQLGTAIGQVHQTYILAQNGAGLVLVDMHAAHERVLYEKLKQAWAEKAIVTQQLLIPVSVQVNPAEWQFCRMHQSLLTAAGFHLEFTEQEGAVFVRALPAILKQQASERLLQAILADCVAEQGEGN